MLRFSSKLIIVQNLLMNVAVAIGVVMMLHVTLDVAARGLFRHGLPAVGEITASYYMIVVVFLPLAWVSYHDTHIRADLFTQLLPAKIRPAIDLMTDLLTIAYLVLIGWQGVVSALKRTATNEIYQIPGGFLPVWPARWLIPVAVAAMILATLLRLINKPEQDDETPEQYQEGA